MRTGGIDIAAFDPGVLAQELGRGICSDYLSEYLKQLKATVCVTEAHYVDRHHLDDFANYYARSFSFPDAHCKRLHFFERLTPEAVRRTVGQAAHEPASIENLEETLQAAYLGFVVVRPLEAARVGRTVLRTYPADGVRHFEVLRPYRVHIAGLRLQLNGLAFQQQDRGAAVCASVALWSALQRVAVVAGHRSPTPHTITSAAASPFAASYGLSDAAMAAALARLGYAADYLEPEHGLGWFRLQLTASLRSHLPVVLLLSKDGPGGSGLGHAVTVTGFREPPNIEAVRTPHVDACTEGIRVRAGSLGVLYVHDDNLGPHAHYELRDAKSGDGNDMLELLRGRSSGINLPRWEVDEWRVDGALVPKPEKLRLSVDGLLKGIVQLSPLLRRAMRPLNVDFDARFTSGVEFVREVLRTAVHPDQLEEFLLKTSLPRHIGLIEVRANDRRLCDLVVDVTEVERNLELPSVIAIVAPGVPQFSRAAFELRAIARLLNARLLTAK